jgi:hypothetical protein
MHKQAGLGVDRGEAAVRGLDDEEDAAVTGQADHLDTPERQGEHEFAAEGEGLEVPDPDGRGLAVARAPCRA